MVTTQSFASLHAINNDILFWVSSIDSTLLFLSQTIYAVLCHFIYLFIYYQFSQVCLCFFLTLAREEIKHMIDNVLLVICTSQIKVMKETYLPEINEMYQRIATKLQQVNCLCNVFRFICPLMIHKPPQLSFCINLFSPSALLVTVSSALITSPTPTTPQPCIDTEELE